MKTAYFIVYSTVILLSFVGLVSTVFIISNADAITYTFKNKMYCGETENCQKIVIDYEMTPKSLSESGVCDYEIASNALQLIAYVYEPTPDKFFKKITEYKDFLYSNKSDNRAIGKIFKNNDDIWIVFRGSDTFNDYISDAQMSQNSILDFEPVNKRNILPGIMMDTDVMIHTGFLRNFINVINPIKKFVSTISKKNKICVVGHSLGAALATLVHSDLIKQGFDSTCYTFGSPRIGNNAFADSIDQLSGNKTSVYRFANSADIVTSTPTSVSPNFKNISTPFVYSHCGVPYDFLKNWKSLFNNHSLGIYNNYVKKLNNN